MHYFISNLNDINHLVEDEFRRLKRINGQLFGSTPEQSDKAESSEPESLVGQAEAKIAKLYAMINLLRDEVTRLETGFDLNDSAPQTLGRGY